MSITLNRYAYRYYGQRAPAHVDAIFYCCFSKSSMKIEVFLKLSNFELLKLWTPYMCT